MVKLKIIYTSLIILCLIPGSKISLGQTYGKLYTKADGEKLYGTVTKSFRFSSEEFSSFLEQTDNVLMFKINDNKLFILGDGRTPIYPVNAIVSTIEVFSVYSILLIRELIDRGKSNMTYFEKRGNILTIANGEYLLEYGLPCPPVCP